MDFIHGVAVVCFGLACLSLLLSIAALLTAREARRIMRILFTKED